MSIRICRVCGNHFDARPVDIERGWSRFCSNECRAIGIRKVNEVEQIAPGVIGIKLTNGLLALVDAGDYDLVKGYGWSAIRPRKGGVWYATATIIENGKKRKLRLHRLIMNPGEGEQVDHINGDGLDNRRANLRLCTSSENNMNRGKKDGYKGVSYYKDRKKWRARIGINGEKRHLGWYATAEEAALAYNKAAGELFGEFARPNEV